MLADIIIFVGVLLVYVSLMVFRREMRYVLNHNNTTIAKAHNEGMARIVALEKQAGIEPKRCDVEGCGCGG